MLLSFSDSIAKVLSVHFDRVFPSFLFIREDRSHTPGDPLFHRAVIVYGDLASERRWCDSNESGGEHPCDRLGASPP